MLALLLYPAGLFTLTLGLVHFWLPLLLDFRAAIPRQGAALRPLRLGPSATPPPAATSMGSPG